MAGDGEAPKPTRLERQAYRMVMLMAHRPERYHAKVARWIDRDKAAREPLFDRVAHATNSAAWEYYTTIPHRRAILHRPKAAAARTLGMLAVATAIFVLVAWRADLPNRWFKRPVAAFAYTETDRTRVGEVRTIGLRDRSTVLLDTDSLLQVHYSRSERSVDLVRGRARFEVAHDADWPFVVYAGGGSVVAKGTVFIVAAGNNVRVHLVSGYVIVRYPPRSNGAAIKPVRLHKGQQVVFEPDMVELPPPPTEARPADEQWVTGMRTFDGQTVQEVIDEVNRYSERKIVLDDPELASRKVFLDLHIRDVPRSAQDLADYLGATVDGSRPEMIHLKR